MENQIIRYIIVHLFCFTLRLYLMKIWKPFKRSLTRNEFNTLFEGLKSEDKDAQNLSCEILLNGKITFLQTFKIINYKLNYRTLENTHPNEEVFDIFGNYVLSKNK